jgi:DNA-binding transcriptional regulator YdaS (Cro superfamily)
MNKYSQAFADAMKRTGLRNTVIATHVGKVGNNCVAQWRTGRRPIPAEHAPKVAGLLGILPEHISESYDRLLKAGALLPDATPGRNAPPAGHVMLSQLEGFGREAEQTRIWLPESITRRKLGLTRPDDVRWTLQPSLSMAPEIERQALVLIDITADRSEEVVDGGLYAYALWGRPDIRRILIRRDAWTLAGTNQEVERVTVTTEELPELRVFGSVIGWI